jgi:hypothetical protein
MTDSLSLSPAPDRPLKQEQRIQRKKKEVVRWVERGKAGAQPRPSFGVDAHSVIVDFNATLSKQSDSVTWHMRQQYQGDNLFLH